MDSETARALTQYLSYVLSCPETRTNNSLIDCTIYLLQQRADTEQTLKEAA